MSLTLIIILAVVGLLVVLMVLKTIVDLAMHQSERDKYKGVDPADIAGRKIPSD